MQEISCFFKRTSKLSLNPELMIVSCFLKNKLMPSSKIGTSKSFPALYTILLHPEFPVLVGALVLRAPFHSLPCVTVLSILWHLCCSALQSALEVLSSEVHPLIHRKCKISPNSCLILLYLFSSRSLCFLSLNFIFFPLISSGLFFFILFSLNKLSKRQLFLLGLHNTFPGLNTSFVFVYLQVLPCYLPCQLIFFNAGGLMCLKSNFVL